MSNVLAGKHLCHVRSSGQGVKWAISLLTRNAVIFLLHFRGKMCTIRALRLRSRWRQEEDIS
jgi:hypothetical protein